MTDALDKFSLLSRNRLQEQFNSAYGVGLLNTQTLLDQQKAADIINAVFPDTIGHVELLDDERFWRALNTALNGVEKGDDPLDPYYSKDGHTLDITGLGLTGSMIIVAGRRAGLHLLKAGGNSFTSINITSCTNLTYLNLSGSPFGGTLALASYTALQYLNLHGCGCTVTGIPSLTALTLLDLTQCAIGGALDVHLATSLASLSLNRVSGLTSVVVPAGLSNFALQQCSGVAVPDLHACTQMETVACRQNSWSQAQVDALIAYVVASEAPAPANFITRYAYEADGGFMVNAHPSAAGYDDAASLVALGWGVDV